MKVALCELPDGLDLSSLAWRGLVDRLTWEAPDLLVLNEMPIGDWIADKSEFRISLAQNFIRSHDPLIQALSAFQWATLGSRPVQGSHLLANEAFLVSGSTYTPVHHKHFFPQEEGWQEKTWFATVRRGFDVVEYGELRIGTLLCTELMFNEWARHYRRRGANVIAVPRAAGELNTKWRAAGAMAAVVSGCYVISSNRSGHKSGRKSQFGGGGFVYAPNGELIAQTSASSPVVVVEIDLELVRQAQADYPCYVDELPVR
jgi:N-carbamoylputrescine amidase